MNTKVGGSAILMGIRRGQRRLRRSGIWKAWGTHEIKGGNMRRRCPGQSLNPSHCDPLITARTSNSGMPATACQFCPRLLTKTLRPTHRRSRSRGAPQAAPSRPLTSSFLARAVAIRCHSNHGAPPQPSKLQCDWTRQASIATARLRCLVEVTLVFRNSSDALSP